MKLCVILAIAFLGAFSAAEAATRIKDITDVKGIRANQLVGYGLVVGLNGTGDSLRNAPFTEQSIQAMLDRMGVNIRGAQNQPRTRNAAAVMVTAELPPFATRGSRFDIVVSSLGDAKSLEGGALIMTPLAGADKVIYAVAQGQITVSGYAKQGRAESVTSGVPTRGRIPNGAMVEQDAPGFLGDPCHLSCNSETRISRPRFASPMQSIATRKTGTVRG